MSFNKHLIKRLGNLYVVQRAYTAVLVCAVLLACSTTNILLGQCEITPLFDPSALPQCAEPGEVFSTTLAYNYQGDLPANIDTIIVTDASSPGFEIISYSPTEIKEGRNELDVSVVYNGSCDGPNLFVCDVIGGGGAKDCSTLITAPIECCDKKSECNFTLITDLNNLPKCATPGVIFTTVLAYNYEGEVPASIDTIIVLDESAPGFEILSYSPSEIKEGRNEIEVSVRYDGDCNESNLFVCDVRGAGGAADCSTIVSSTISCCAEPCETIGGVLSGNDFEFCVGDGEADFVSGIEVSENSGSNGQWVVTGEDTEILGLPNRPEDVNFDEAPPGECYIWHVSYENISGLEVGKLATDLTGCFSFSKGMVVYRTDCDAEPCMITPQIDQSDIPSCAVPGEVTTINLSYDYQGELPASIDTIVVWDPAKTGYSIIDFGPTDIVKGANVLSIDVVYDGDCESDLNFVIDLVGGGEAFGCNPAVDLTIPCCSDEKCVVTPLTDVSDLPTCAVQGEVFTTTLAFDYQGSLPANIDTIIVTDESAPGFEIISYSPTEIQRGRNEMEVSVVYDGDCNESNLFVCDVIGGGGAAECTTTVRSPIACCDAEKCVVTPITDLSTLPTCAVPGEVFTTTLVYDYQGSLPASIDTIIVTDESAPGFEIISYSPSEIQRGRNEMEVSVVYDGDCNESNLFVCDVIGGGGAAECTTTVRSPIPCCDDEKCVVTPITDLSTLPTCAVPGEVFTTTLVYDYQGSLPAGIDTIIVTDASAEGFTILSFSPTEMVRGKNEMEVSVVYDGDCNEGNLFVCDVIGYGGAADCTTTVSSPIPCCDDDKCVITPLTDISTLPTCTTVGEVFTTTLAYDYQGSLPASIDTIIVTDASADGFEILSYGPTEIKRGTNEIEVSVVYNGDCNESNLFVCDVIGAGGAADCTTTVSSPIPCCDDEGEEKECLITPITDLSGLPRCASPGDEFTATLAYDYQGELPAYIDTIYVTEDSAPGFKIVGYSPTEMVVGRNEITATVTFDGTCDQTNIFICEVVGGGGASACSQTISLPIPCCEEEDCGDQDTDADGVNDDCDSCPLTPNPDQEDDNENGIGDACEEPCEIEPIVEGLEIPDCLKQGETFTTKLQYEYSGSLPASIDTIVLREESTEGFEIISYSPSEIVAGVNEMEVSVVFNGDCEASNLFICDIVGAGGAASCSFTISSSIKCCEAELIDLETYPNPTTDVIFVKAETRSNYMVEIYNNNGEKVMSSEKKDQDFFILKTNELNNGTYFMKVTDMESGKIGTSTLAVFR